MVSKKVEKLCSGDPYQFEDNVKFKLMMNYDIFRVADATELSGIFNEEYLDCYLPIPISVEFDVTANDENSILFPLFYKKIVVVYFLLNVLLFRYYETTSYPECDVQMDFSQLMEYIDVLLEKFEKQSAFHKMESTFDEFMNVLGQFQKKIETMTDVEKDEMNNESDYFVKCAGKLNKMAKRNFIPEKNSFISKTYKNENDGNQIMKFLSYDYRVKDWPNVLVIPNKQWIGLFRQLYGEDEVNMNSKCNKNTIDNFVWVYDKKEIRTEPFILLSGEKYSIGVIKQEADGGCQHVSNLSDEKWICLDCNAIVKQQNGYFMCNCGRKCWFEQSVKKTSVFQRAVKNSTPDQSFQLQQYEPSNQAISPERFKSKLELPTNSTKAYIAEQTDSCDKVGEESIKTLIDEQRISKADNKIESSKKLANGQEAMQQKELSVESEQRTVNSNELKKQLEDEKSQRQKMELACQNREIEELKVIENTFRENIRKLNAQIEKLQNELKSHQSEVNKVHEEYENLMQKYQQLETKKNENEQTINNLRMENNSLVRVMTKELTKSDDNEKMMEEENRKLNAEIMKLQTELNTHESEFNETLKGITTLTEENQQLKRKNGENEQTINYLQMEIAQLMEVATDLKDKLTKANDNGKKMEEDNQKFNGQIGKLENELKSDQSILNKTHEENGNLSQQHQEVETKNNENQQRINNLEMRISQLLEVENKLNGKLTNANNNQRMMEIISDKKLKASKKLAKWAKAMEQKEPFVKPEQKAAYDHALECLKFMTKKHGSTLNTSELTTDIQQLTKEEFTDAIDNFVKTCENSGRLLQKCKEIVEVLERE
uniref:Uncharacterized protein n=1 Tax=Panagrolaimus sp. JU765 TaxID=591449 RepID=A0AC34QBB9_9BILA